MFINTENKLLIDIQNQDISNLLLNLINQNRYSLKSYIGDYFAVKIKKNKYLNLQKKYIFIYPRKIKWMWQIS